MKELSIAGKATRYDEAIEKLRRLHDDYDTVSTLIDIKKELEEMFPELAESEDERIRKYLISFVELNSGVNLPPEDAEQILAWLEKQGNANKEYWRGYREGKQEILDKYAELEKQGSQILANSCKTCKDEQKPADKVEPKFKVGDWVVYENRVGLIVRMLKENYIISFDGVKEQVSFTFNDRIAKWTIKDAKAGDVLATEGFVFIFKEIREDKGIGYFCANEKELHEGDNDTFHIANPNSLMGSINNGFTHYTPATEEQRNQLEKAMANAGYTFDFEKKELKKIEQNPVRQQCADFYNKNSELQMPRLTAFENELANILFDREYDGSTETEDDIQRGKLDYKLAAIRLAPKLQSLINNEQKPAWSEEQLDSITAAINNLEYLRNNYVYHPMGLEPAITFLKSLKDIVQQQPNTDWSEEDELIINKILCICNDFERSFEMSPLSTKVIKEDVDKIDNWLKSIKYRYTWKPSDEQMKALDFAADCIVPDEFCFKRKALKELYKDLKKLREE